VSRKYFCQGSAIVDIDTKIVDDNLVWHWIHIFIAAVTVVNKSVQNYVLKAVIQAKQIGCISEYGQQLDFPLPDKAETKCLHTDDVDLLQYDTLTKII
jgi:hypothetical protein